MSSSGKNDFILYSNRKMLYIDMYNQLSTKHNWKKGSFHVLLDIYSG